MANPDFPLAPWEVPPGSDIPLVAPADLVLKNDWGNYEWGQFEWGEDVLARRIVTPNGPRVYYRDAQSSQVGNWLIGAEQKDSFFTRWTTHWF